VEGEPGLDSPSDNVKWLTFAEIADEYCPIYMSMGVPYDEYWHGDYTQLAYFRKAFEIERDRANHDAWLQGAYIYDALCAVSPVLNAFAKRGTKPMPYLKEPYGMKLDEASTDAPEKKQTKTNEEIQALNASAKFASFMTQWNKRFESKGGEANGADD
jgi:hypothetical protein